MQREMLLGFGNGYHLGSVSGQMWRRRHTPRAFVPLCVNIGWDIDCMRRTHKIYFFQRI